MDAESSSQAITDLLGVLAYGELQAFDRLAADATMAPDLPGRQAVIEMAIAEYGHHRKLVDGLVDRGVDPWTAMRPFAEAIDSFHASTTPADYPEALVKMYVGDGIGADFYREVAEYVDPKTRELVEEVCGDLGHSEFVVPTVRDLIAADRTLASRLSLWGRRLVGEALSQAQHVAAEHESIGELLVGSSDLMELQRMLKRLTDAHSRRMRQMGLNA